MLRSAQNCKKCLFRDNLRTITHEGNMETRQMTPFFSSTFSDLTVYNIHFCIWNQSKFILMWSLLCSVLVCEISHFWVKVIDLDNPSSFSRKWHPEFTKNPYYVLSLKWSQKKVSAHELLISKLTRIINKGRRDKMR